jgi:hypothetical protein
MRKTEAGGGIGLTRWRRPLRLELDRRFAAYLHEDRDRLVLALEGEADLDLAFVRRDRLPSLQDSFGQALDRIADNPGGRVTCRRSRRSATTCRAI